MSHVAEKFLEVITYHRHLNERKKAHRFGPAHPTGLILSLQTGSQRILTPLSAPGAAEVYTKKDACPIQVAFKPVFPEPQSGVRTLTSSSFPGTGNVLRPLPNLVWTKSHAECSMNEGQGLRKEVGGVPTWWDGISNEGSFERFEPMEPTEGAIYF